MDKTTVRIHETLKRDIDIHVAQVGLTFQQVFNIALRKYLADEEKIKLTKKKAWVSSLNALDLGRERYLLTRENIYTKDEDITR